MMDRILISLTIIFLSNICALGQIEGNLISCDGKVILSLPNSSTADSVVWDWKDGTFSTGSNIIHNYSTPGIYPISATVYTAGNSVVYYPATALDVSLNSTCSAQSNYCCGYGISSFEMGNFFNSSLNASEGNRNFECLDTIQVYEGAKIEFEINANSQIVQDFKIWLDLNNNQIIENDELIYEKNNVKSIHDSISVPHQVVLNQSLLLVVGSDISGSGFEFCQSISRGQFETYRIKINQSQEQPIAEFHSSLSDNKTCNGYVHFHNNSTGSPSYYFWDFGNGETSNEENPSVKYENNGWYTVTLIAGNSQGYDTIIKTDFVNVELSHVCDTIWIPNNGIYIENWICNGVIMDNNKQFNYSDNSNGSLILAPAWAKSIALKFDEFNFENGFDYLYIYDGPSENYPLIGKFTGNNLPNGGLIQSNGPGLLLIQKTDDVYNLSGFLARMTCTLTQENTITTNNISIYPNPTSEVLYINSDTPLNLIRILDLTGRQVLETYSSEIVVNHLKPGIYLISLETKNNKVVKKWVRSEH